MKKSTLINIIDCLNGDNSIDRAELVAELTTEYTRLTEKARKNAELYESARERILSVLSPDTELTVTEIYHKLEGTLPRGFSPSKIQYGLLNPWRDQVVVHDNNKNPNTYSLAVS